MNPFATNIWRDPSYRFYRSLLVDHVFPIRARTWTKRIAGLIVIFHVIIVVGPTLLERLVPNAKHVITPFMAKEVTTTIGSAIEGVPQIVTVPQFMPILGGLELPLSPETPYGNAIFMLALSVWIIASVFSWFRNSYYYHVEGLLERGETGSKTPYTTPNYEVCAIYWDTKYGDLTRSFAKSPYGQIVLMRAGIGQEVIEKYLSSRQHIVDFNNFASEVPRAYTLLDLIRFIIAKDPDFYQFIFQIGIRERDITGTAEWVERDLKRQKQRTRWWGKVNLGQGTSIGADLAYGGAYLLGRYSTDLTRKAMSGGSNFRFVYGNDEIRQLEQVLSRAKEANAILVGEEGTGKMDIVLDFARDIMNGYTNPALKHKRVMAFDAKAFLANMKTKQELEQTMIKLMNDVVDAGNIILVIDDLPGFILGANEVGSNIISVIDPYLRGDAIQLIATADNGRFHQLIESNTSIMQRFEKVNLVEPEEESVVRILEEVAEATERRNPVYFTYPAVVEIVRSAESYFPGGVMPDKAIDLLVELVPYILARGGSLIKKLDVLAFVRDKTNIPVGEINSAEREKLMQLEALLKQQVIGQEKALEVVANAMRRSRAGVRNQERPIGTFLFLGPTGVGKTETAKALAKVFFGDENAMSRIDMSELQGDDGLERMIGSMDGTLGLLPVMLREHQYGVVLLDEFEKTNAKVLDLFLQVFDEGMFHDAQGKKVSARNSIFIATSNAGANLIRQAIAQGKDLEEVKKEIIDEIIAQGRLKPELFNRFDGVILFHPLTVEDYRKVATLLLTKLQKRLRDKSINLVINDVLVDEVMKHGVDPDFGARPMIRAVQEVVEQKVADKIIRGDLRDGSTLEFTPEDFAS